MPSTITWRGDAPKVAQVDWLTLGGTWENNDNLSVTINGKSVSIVSGATSIVTILASLLAALQASVIPEFLEITWTSDASVKILATAKTAGKPFTITVSTTENGGGAADSQTFVKTTPVANSGPADAAIAANYSGGALPITGDTLVFENSTADMLYNLTALSAVTLALLEVKANYTGRIGLPRMNADDTSYPYYEYRPDYFLVGATLCRIGSGPGGGSGRVKINAGSVQTAVSVLGTGGTAENGLGAFIWKGTNAGNQLEALKGSVSVAPFAGETANLSGGCHIAHLENKASDVTVTIGAGVTLDEVTKSGGNLQTESAMALALMAESSGQWTHLAGAIAAAEMNGGTLFYRASDTLGSCKIGGKAVLDFRQDATPVTVGSLEIKSAGCEIHDENGRVTWTSIDPLPEGVGLEDITFRFGKGRTITIA